MDVNVVGYARTPTGSFLGSLSSLSCVELGVHATKADQVDAVYFGNVLSANLGQSPATQVSIGSGIPANVPTTTINKVCASGMKAVMIGCQDIRTGDARIVVAGGMESMSNVPHYVTKHRSGNKYGHQELLDGIMRDGLSDAFSQFLMGDAAELCAKDYSITRQEQDNYAIQSYQRAIQAHQSGAFANEIVPVEVNARGKIVVVAKDEEIDNFNEERTRTARPAFQNPGTVTGPNASPLNDGASAVVLANSFAVAELGLKPLARIIAFADASQVSEKFTTSPSVAIPLALKKANLTIEQVDLFEINEAFSVVALANLKLLGIPAEKCNIYGGGVSLGHPLGSSGSRIIATLITALHNNNLKIGVAAVCNGGGGASAVVIERC